MTPRLGGKVASRGGRSAKRDAFDVSNDPLAALLRPSVLSTVSDPPLASLSLSEIDDRRVWHPERSDRSVRTLVGPARAQVADDVRRHSPVPPHISFRAPDTVVECVRRSQRREVLFAKKRTRRGAGARSHRWSWRSNIRCR